MKTLVFVDDEQNILQGLKRMLHGMRKQWKMHFFDNAQEALEFILANDVDVLVSDVRMPGMDGVHLLKAVRESSPNVIRMILSGHSDYTKALESTRVAHQFLSKPCDAKKLIATVERNLLLEEQLHNEKILSLITGYDALPSSPVIYQQIMQAIESDDSSLADISRLIEQDVAMTAKILQLVNSAFFGLPRNFVKISEALAYLGIDTVKTLVLMHGVFNTLAEVSDEFRSQMERIWQHSLHTSYLAKAIAKDMGLSPKARDNATVAAMLHDIGQMVLQTFMLDDYAQVRQKAVAETQLLTEVETLELGCSHADIGGYLLSLWGLPTIIIEAVLFHHNPDKSTITEFSEISAVYFANLIVDGDEALLNQDYLLAVADADAWSRWLELDNQD